MKAIFAAGCFWGVEERFRELGLKTKVGYTGGKTKNPSYEEVCSGKTGHIESVEVTYEESKISYEALLQMFWKIHDPTQGMRQGPDKGEQYQSVIFYTSQEQKEEAEKSLEAEQKKHDKPITTTIRAAEEFYDAEEYHQQYLAKRNKKICGI